MELYLDHLKGERAGSLDRFAKDVIRVGRNSEFELCFDDLGVSYEHAELRLRDGDFWLVDRGSTNGSYVNEERAYNARLRDGDILRFGKKGPTVRFRLTALPDDGERLAAAATSKGQAGSTAVQPSAPPFDLTRELGSAAISPPTVGSGSSSGSGSGIDALVDVPPLAPKPPAMPPLETGRKPRRMTVAHLDALGPDGERRGAAAPPLAAPSSSEGASSSSGGLSDGSGSGLQARRGGERRIQIGVARTPRSMYAALTLSSVVAVLGASAAVALYVEVDRKNRTLEVETKRADQNKRSLDELKRDKDELEREMERAVLRVRDETRAIIERLESSLERERKDARKGDASARARIEQLQLELARKDGELAQLRRSAGSTGDENAGFKVIQKRYARSIVLVACQFNLKKKGGGYEPFHGFGSGFFVSKDGLIVTNKHVLEPWKFRPLAQRIAQENLEVDLSSYAVHVWIAGTRFSSGHVLDVSTSYSTTRRTLEKVKLAMDRWRSEPMPAGTSSSSGRYVQVHGDGNEDLAVLKAQGGPFEPIPLRRPGDGPIEKLDKVLLLGFPAGPSILEKGVAEITPSIGDVRKVEDTIQTSAPMTQGNSGGPLLDSDGRVIGVATRVLTTAENLGICIKVDYVANLLEGAW